MSYFCFYFLGRSVEWIHFTIFEVNREKKRVQQGQKWWFKERFWAEPNSSHPVTESQWNMIMIDSVIQQEGRDDLPGRSGLWVGRESNLDTVNWHTPRQVPARATAALIRCPPGYQPRPLTLKFHPQKKGVQMKAKEKERKEEKDVSPVPLTCLAITFTPGNYRAHRQFYPAGEWAGKTVERRSHTNPFGL